MKKSMIVILAAIVIMMMGCVKDIEKYGFVNTTVLSGIVVTAPNYNPVQGVNVCITDGYWVYTSCITDENGSFELEVDFDAINEHYYLFLDGGTEGKTKKYELRGFGLENYNYQNVVLYEDVILPQFYYNGITYEVYTKEVEGMNYEEALSFCADLVYAGYSDWSMPGTNELEALYINRVNLGLSSLQYWGTERKAINYENYAITLDFSSGDWSWSNTTLCQYPVIPIRKVATSK